MPAAELSVHILSIVGPIIQQIVELWPPWYSGSKAKAKLKAHGRKPPCQLGKADRSDAFAFETVDGRPAHTRSLRKLDSCQLALLEGEPNAMRNEIALFEKTIDSKAAALLIGVHYKTLERLARMGKVPATKIGKGWSFRASQLSGWIDSMLAKNLIS